MYKHIHTHTWIVNELRNYYYCELELMFTADILGKSFGVNVCFYYKTMWRITTYIFSYSVFFKKFFWFCYFKNYVFPGLRFF